MRVFLLPLAVSGCCLLTAPAARAQGEAVTLREQFTPDDVSRVRLESNLSGRLAVPKPDKKSVDVLPFVAKSVLEYDERPLLPLDDGSGRVVRQYATVKFDRTVGDTAQTAEVRPAVRRMVVLRGTLGLGKGKKLPFSPDGALTLGEMGVVRNDLFSPVLVPGLLPDKPVKPGDRWAVADAAVVELTDYEAVESHALTVEFAAVVRVNGKRSAKLLLSGTVRGTTEDGPSRQALAGTAYFDLDTNRLSYLKLTGQSQLLGPKGVTAGEVTGTFTLTRSKADAPAGLTADALAKTELKPTPTNTLLLHDDPANGLSLRHPRNWRVGRTAGQQLAVDESSGKGSLLVTVLPPGQVPTAAQYLAEVKAFGVKQQWQLLGETPVTRDPGDPTLDRFALDIATAKGEKLRLECALVTTPAGGATLAARLAAGADAAALKADFAGIARSVRIVKPAE